MELFNEVAGRCSRIATNRYSTSFSMGIKLLNRKYHNDIYAIYGFVRFADEIVDSFLTFDRKELLSKFTTDTWEAIDKGISLNPILNSFQQTVNKHKIHHHLIRDFLKSMEMDLERSAHTTHTYEQYIFGSAEAVGLMCLQVFCEGDEKHYKELEMPARSLGAAFQKVNFLRDLGYDQGMLGRNYFPEANSGVINDDLKARIETEIQADFDHALTGIFKLPQGCRLGVYSAYLLYKRLFAKIRNTPAGIVINKRIRVPNKEKLVVLFTGYLRNQFNIL